MSQMDAPFSPFQYQSSLTPSFEVREPFDQDDPSGAQQGALHFEDADGVADRQPPVAFPAAEKLALLCTALTPGIGPKTFYQLSQCLTQGRDGLRFQDLHKMDASSLKSLGVSAKSAEHMRRYPPNHPHKIVEKTLRWQENDAHHLVFWGDDHYPSRLLEVASPPPMLMVKGRLMALNMPQMAVVGSRHPTAGGYQQAYDFSQRLSDADLVVTSGLAKGVDAAAHLGALDAQGLTIAVMGTGLEHIYPKQHQSLADQIVERGALVSEFPLDTKPHPGNFPRRNRIVSGMSLGCLVVEATLKSGSLITARQALEQNREVFAIPGSIQNPQKAGCHYLIRQGAALVETVEDILQELPQIQPPQTFVDKSMQYEQRKSLLDFARTDEEQALLAALDFDGCSVDTLSERSQLSVVFITGQLIQWEIQGRVQHQDGLYHLL